MMSKLFRSLLFLPGFLLTAVSFGAEEGCPILSVQQAQFASREGATVSAGGEVQVISLNIKGETSTERLLRELRGSSNLSEPDVLLLQEVEEFPEQDFNVVSDLAERMGFDSIFAPAQEREDGRLHGLALLSRFPLIDVDVIPLPQFDLNYRTRCRIALAATVTAAPGDIRVYNLHLDTRINSKRRFEQIRPVLQAARSFEGPSIVGGDLNTGDVYWIGHMVPVPFGQKQSKRLKTAIEAEGFSTPFEGTGKTHRWAPLRLDWIFLRKLLSVDHGIERIEFTDHRALWTRLRINEQSADENTP